MYSKIAATERAPWMSWIHWECVNACNHIISSLSSLFIYVSTTYCPLASLVVQFCSLISHMKICRHSCVPEPLSCAANDCNWTKSQPVRLYWRVTSLYEWHASLNSLHFRFFSTSLKHLAHPKYAYMICRFTWSTPPILYWGEHRYSIVFSVKQEGIWFVEGHTETNGELSSGFTRWTGDERGFNCERIA
jgi:hypothetical protein